MLAWRNGSQYIAGHLVGVAVRSWRVAGADACDCHASADLARAALYWHHCRLHITDGADVADGRGGFTAVCPMFVGNHR